MADLGPAGMGRGPRGVEVWWLVACVGVQGAELHLILCSHDLETQHFLNKGLAFPFFPELWHGALSRQGSVMFLSVDGAPGSRLELGAKLHSIPQSPSLLPPHPARHFRAVFLS